LISDYKLTKTHQILYEKCMAPAFAQGFVAAGCPCRIEYEVLDKNGAAICKKEATEDLIPLGRPLL
jgi:hypothetical protein